MKDGILPDGSTTLTFGSLKCEIRAPNALPNGNSADSSNLQMWRGPAKDTAPAGKGFRVPVIRTHEKGTGAPWMKPHPGGVQRPGAVENRRPPPQPVGQSRRPKGPDQWASANGRRDGEYGSDKGDFSLKLPLTAQLDKPGPPTGNNLHSVPAVDIDERLRVLRPDVVADRHSSGIRRMDRMSDTDGGGIEQEMLLEHTASLVVGDEAEANKNVTAKKKNGSRSEVKLSPISYLLLL